MKLTKEKLEQLILETYKSYVRSPSDDGKPTNYPQYADKLSNLAKSDPLQARELADSLGEPLDIEYDPSNMKTMHIPDPEKGEGYHGVDGPYFTHVRYVMWANQNGYPELTFTDEIVPEAVRAFANAEGLDYEKTLSAVKFNLSNNKKARIRKAVGKPNPDKQVADMYGFDRDPFGDDDF